MIDRDSLLARLETMKSLPENWDGFGSSPVSPSVYRICSKIVEYIDPNTESIKFFVGVKSAGSAFIEIKTDKKKYEFTVTRDGTIFYDELLGEIEIGSGLFFLSKEKLQELLKS
jgi:hypothetical protein